MTGTVAHCPISSLHLIMRVETCLVMWLHIPCYHPECATDKLVYTSLPTVPLHIFLRLSFFTAKRQYFLLVQHLGCSDSTPHLFFLQAVEGAVGLPVAVQCVALPWQEELCLRFMKEVETLSRSRRNVWFIRICLHDNFSFPVLLSSHLLPNAQSKVDSELQTLNHHFNKMTINAL